MSREAGGKDLQEGDVLANLSPQAIGIIEAGLGYIS